MFEDAMTSTFLQYETADFSNKISTYFASANLMARHGIEPYPLALGPSAVCRRGKPRSGNPRTSKVLMPPSRSIFCSSVILLRMAFTFRSNSGESGDGACAREKEASKSRGAQLRKSFRISSPGSNRPGSNNLILQNRYCRSVRKTTRNFTGLGRGTALRLVLLTGRGCLCCWLGNYGLW